MMEIIFFIIKMVSITITTITIIILFNRNIKSNWFNGKLRYGKNLKEIKFNVSKIDLSFDDDNERIVKYTVTTGFFNKKNNGDYHYNEFVFFDEVGKYNLGDEFILTKVTN